MQSKPKIEPQIHFLWQTETPISVSKKTTPDYKSAAANDKTSEEEIDEAVEILMRRK